MQKRTAAAPTSSALSDIAKRYAMASFSGEMPKPGSGGWASATLHQMSQFDEWDSDGSDEIRMLCEYGALFAAIVPVARWACGDLDTVGNERTLIDAGIIPIFITGGRSGWDGAIHFAGNLVCLDGGGRTLQIENGELRLEIGDCPWYRCKEHLARFGAIARLPYPIDGHCPFVAVFGCTAAISGQIISEKRSISPHKLKGVGV